jgi:hypothetical protein
MLTMPLYWGTPASGAYTSHRTMLLLLEYAEQKLTPVFATPVVNADVCQGFNVQMSYKPGNPAKVSRSRVFCREANAVCLQSFTIQASPYNAMPPFKLEWNGKAFSL